jgi:hypothetical protein
MKRLPIGGVTGAPGIDTQITESGPAGAAATGWHVTVFNRTKHGYAISKYAWVICANVTP